MKEEHPPAVTGSNVPVVTALTASDIQKYICPEANEREVINFLNLCRGLGANPFYKEIYLIKYSKTSVATTVIGKDFFMKKASRHPKFNGFKAGITVLDLDGNLTHRDGALSVKGEELLGAWAEVYRSDRSNSFRVEVSYTEYVQEKDGKPNAQWKKRPNTMLRKVALVQALREAFPDDLSGAYAPEEMGVDAEALPTYEHGEAPKHPDIAVSAASEGPKAVSEPSAPSDEPGGAPQGESGEKPAEQVAGGATSLQVTNIFGLLNNLDIKDPGSQHEKVSEILALTKTLVSMNDLSKDQATEVSEVLAAELQGKQDKG